MYIKAYTMLAANGICCQANILAYRMVGIRMLLVIPQVVRVIECFY